MGDRQQKIYDFVKVYIEVNKYSPTMREIATGVGLKSPSTVHGHLDRMRENGYVDFVDSTARTLRVVI